MYVKWSNSGSSSIAVRKVSEAGQDSRAARKSPRRSQTAQDNSSGLASTKAELNTTAAKQIQSTTVLMCKPNASEGWEITAGTPSNNFLGDCRKVQDSER
eukprot:1153902-Pelagomonas_calceolata.AAC.2